MVAWILFIIFIPLLSMNKDQEEDISRNAIWCFLDSVEQESIDKEGREIANKIDNLLTKINKSDAFGKESTQMFEEAELLQEELENLFEQFSLHCCPPTEDEEKKLKGNK